MPGCGLVSEVLTMSGIITSIEQQELFRILCHEAAACRACPRMAGKSAVLSGRNGMLGAKVLFVGEAPARLGADRTRRPFHGDQAGIRFDQLLASINLSRREIFITNAVLCCPASDTHNATPTHQEVRSCGRFLEEVIQLIAPPVIATLGAVALRSVGRIIGDPLVLAEVAGSIIEYPDFMLVPLYHPGPNVLHAVRSYDQQLADFTAVREAITYTTTAMV